MDDLEAVLASLEQTEAALRPPATRARDLQAELDALPPLAPPTPSEQHHLSTSLAAELDAELDAVFAKPLSESLLPGGLVHNLGARHNDFVKNANRMIEEIRNFSNRVKTLDMRVVPCDAIDDEIKQSMEDINKAYDELYGRAELLFTTFSTFTPAEKQYHDVSSAKQNLSKIRKELAEVFQHLLESFKLRTEEGEKKQKKSTDTARNGTSTEDFSEITRAADDEGQYDHKATEALYKKTVVELDALKDKTNRAEEIVKTAVDFIVSERAKGTFQSNNKTDEADKFHSDLMVAFVEMSLQRSKTQQYMSSWREYVKNHVPSHSPNYALLPTWNALEKQYVDFELQLEGEIDEQLLELHKICTIKYIKTIHDFEAKHKLSFTKTHAPNPHVPTVFHGPRAPSAFPPELTDFAQKLIALVYPPTRVPPWSASAKAVRTAPPRTHNTDVHNKHLAALCARVAHIAGVANFSPALAALRFAVELAPASPLLAGARQKQPAVLVSRETATPHPNHKQILDLLAASNLARLLRLAQTELQHHAYSKHASPHAHTFRHEHTHKHESEHSHPKHSTQQRSEHEDRNQQDRNHKHPNHKHPNHEKLNHEKLNHDKHTDTRQEKSKKKSVGPNWLKNWIPNFSGHEGHGAATDSSGGAHDKQKSILHQLHDAVEEIASPRKHPPSTSV
jgi:hypothetical protein